MSGASVRLEHVGAGCNRVVHALHWGESGLLAYAAQNAVVVYHIEEARVLGTLLGHTDCVNCVRWLSAADFGLPAAAAQQHPPAGAVASAAPLALASGSGDCSVRIWLWTPATPAQPWRLAAQLEGHTSPVTSITTFGLGGGSLLLVSTAGDGEVLVWECSGSSRSSGGDGGSSDSAAAAGGDGACGGDCTATSNSGSSSGGSSCPAFGPEHAVQSAWRLRQRIPVGFQLQDCAALSALPADPGWVLLALGGVDGVVRLYTCPPAGQFAAVCQLAGHQDWVKGLAFAQMDDGKLLLASASQDKNVRVWAVTQQQQDQQPGCQQAGQQPASSSATSGSAGSSGSSSSAGAPLGISSLAQALTRYAPKPLISTQQHTYRATLEALLVGHEDWVHSVAWHPRVQQPVGNGTSHAGSSGIAGVGNGGGDGGTSQPACLLSASMDRTMMLWRADEATGLWMSEESVGDAGANHLGYYTGVFSPDGSGIAAHGFTGALHIWRRQREEDGGGWLPQHALGGHFAPVVDACWAADGACLLTVSTDQTARITTRLHTGHWCEIARPQVHGHDFSAVAALPSTQAAGGRHLYASGSEEKVIRVFEAPRAFRDTLAMARGQPVSSSSCGGGGSGGGSGPTGDSSSGRGALGALLPALGLSNKAVYQEEEAAAGSGGGGGGNGAAGSSSGGGGTGVAGEACTDGPDLAPHAAPSAVAGPPLEEHLSQNTLWPEIHKLYGHGNELYCLAADPLGRFIASACRAQSADTAAIWLWDTRKWIGAAQLRAHTLTVTQLAFSPNGRFLASASRDRTVAVFERQPQPQQSPPPPLQQQQGGERPAGARTTAAAGGLPVEADADSVSGFRLVGRIKAHTRIVWGLHWSPDSRLLATASRDAKVKVWSMGGAGQSSPTAAGSSDGPMLVLPAAPAATVACGDSVRSVQFAPDCQPGASYHLAAGLDNGSVQLLHVAADAAPGGQLAVSRHRLLWESSQFERHAAAVRRLCWRQDDDAQEGAARRYHLASCSDDHSLRVYSVTL